MQWKRLKWKVRTLRRFGLAHMRSTLVTFPSSLNFSGEAWLRDAQGSVQFPVVLRVGSALRLSHILLEWRSNKRCQPRVAVHLGSGKIGRPRCCLRTPSS